jgi:hypothetical protein
MPDRSVAREVARRARPMLSTRGLALGVTPRANHGFTAGMRIVLPRGNTDETLAVRQVRLRRPRVGGAVIMH